MKLSIKNMVCDRCKMVVKSELEKLGHPLVSVDLGEVETVDSITNEQRDALHLHLRSFGFELISDKKSGIIEQIKILIIDLVHHRNNEIDTNLSEYLAHSLQQDYYTLSRLFSESEGITIEKYFINQKIEKVKELIIYDEMSLSEIAFVLHYSSVAYLSNQFKKVTGLTPTLFKQLEHKERKQIDLI